MPSEHPSVGRACAGCRTPLAAMQGFSMALAGNTLLLTYFIGRRESSAALIQALGVGSNFILLAQVISFATCTGSWVMWRNGSHQVSQSPATAVCQIAAVWEEGLVTGNHL